MTGSYGQNELETRLQKEIAEYKHTIEKMRILINASPDLICFKDAKGHWLEANEAALHFLGLTGSDFRGKKDSELAAISSFHSKSLLTCQATDEVAWQKRSLSRGDEEIKQPDGTCQTLDMIKVPLFHSDGRRKGLVILGRDISQRRQIEEEFRKLSSAVEQSPAIVAITDIKGNLEYVNPKFSELTGYTLEEVIGKNPRILQSGMTPKDDYRRLWAAISRGLEWKGTFCNKKKNGEFYWEEATISQIRDNEGNITHYLKVAEDITQRKKLEDQLIQAQKLEAVGRLAGGVAHDFNNLLTVISGYSELVLDGLSEQDPLRKDVYEIKKAGEKAAILTEQLLAFSRKKLLLPKVFDLNGVINNLLKMLKRLIGEDIEIITFLENDLVRIKADPGQIEQVIVNIAVNARDAMPGGGKLTIETANVYLDEPFVMLHPELKQGSYIILSVSDTGTGMDRATLDHIFDPFFTTKEQGKGTGLGLSMAYGIITQSGGAILTESEPGRGSVFKIYLPGLVESESLAQQEEKKAISSC